MCTPWETWSVLMRDEWGRADTYHTCIVVPKYCQQKKIYAVHPDKQPICKEDAGCSVEKRFFVPDEANFIRESDDVIVDYHCCLAMKPDGQI